jgi:S-adenosylmethionine:tRNA ribosyltransferase-isomerase
MRTADFDYVLPHELIAQQPAPQRDQSRLLTLHRNSGKIEHRHFRDLPGYLRQGDVLVLNNSRVIPARLRGVNAKTRGRFEMLLLTENDRNDWWVMMKPGKRARVGTEIEVRSPKSEVRSSAGVTATVVETNHEGHRRLRFEGTNDIAAILNDLGEVPLPPYITRENVVEDKERYQTVFADPAGSVAAPTAGLHFTEAVIQEIRSLGVNVCFVTLHVGLATFSPVKAEMVSHHKMHEERYEVSEATARIVDEAKASGRRIVAVGTTTVRVLESACGARPVPGRAPQLQPGPGRTRIFVHPPFQFRIVDVLLTNFHLPRSTLLMLVSAFASPENTSGRETILSAYAEAIRQRYGFYSYGDAMLIL